MEMLLEEATKKYSIKNKIEKEDYELPINEFILKIYLNCDPGSYGKFFSNKLIYDLKKEYGRSVGRVDDNLDRGDIFFNHFPNMYYMYDSDKLESTYYEIKISFLGKSNFFTIRNLRFYQELDGFLITFVNCKNNFEPSFYLIDKKDLYEECGLTFTVMNGTKDRNKNNTDVGYGTTIKLYSSQYFEFEDRNKLNGTEYTDLLEHFKKLNEEYKEKFKKVEKKYESNLPRFYALGKYYLSNNFVDNYFSFLTEISKTKDCDFFKKIIDSKYISKEKTSKKFRNVGDNFFVDSKLSNEIMKKHISMICSKLNGNSIFYNNNQLNSIVDSELEGEILYLLRYDDSIDYISSYLNCDEEVVRSFKYKKEKFCVEYKERYDIANRQLPEIFKLFKKTKYGWENEHGEQLMQYCNRFYLVDYELCRLFYDKYGLYEEDLENMLVRFLDDKIKNNTMMGVSFY
jgi:hypothetical protein